MAEAQRVQQQERSQDEQQLEGQLAFQTENDAARQKIQLKKDQLLKKHEQHESMQEDLQENRDKFTNVLAQCLEVCCHPPFNSLYSSPVLSRYCCCGAAIPHNRYRRKERHA